jgi:propanol-preferring alcohol dehydrogenase
MHAMVLTRIGQPLQLMERPDPLPGPGEIQVAIAACGVCRTDLHVVDGELPDQPLPIIPGHEIVGRIAAVGPGVEGMAVGQRVGLAWLARTCGRCRYCRSGSENLCDHPAFRGYTLDGGYATRVCADAAFAFPLPEGGSDAATAPLLCAGLIGWRALAFAGPATQLGLYGFGAAAHLIAQVAIAQGRAVHAFCRPGDAASCAFARRLGATWAGGSDERPPVELDAAIIFAPVGSLVPAALAAVRKGGRVVCAGIHMSDIPSFPYRLLWQERQICSVANLTRADGRDFLEMAARTGVAAATRTYPLAAANAALDDLRHGRFDGAAVLIMPAAEEAPPTLCPPPA